MMTKPLVVVLGAWAVLGLGCGESESDPPEDGESKDTVQIELPDFQIPAGESFKCYYSDVVTDRELSVVAAKGAQVKGGHHLSLYYVDNQREPGLQDCDGKTEMVDWHFVVGAGGEGNANDYLQLAEGLAFKIPPGKQLMVQAHYINVSGGEMKSEDKLDVELIDPAKVTAYAADFVVDDDTFLIEPNSELTTTMTCSVPQDLSLTMLLGHMHEQGKHYRLEVVDAQGEVVKVLYEEQWAASYASHPPLLHYTKEEPLQLAKGTLLRQTCTWNNTTGQPLAFPTEMCIGFGYYFPGTERIMCERVEASP